MPHVVLTVSPFGAFEEFEVIEQPSLQAITAALFRLFEVTDGRSATREVRLTVPYEDQGEENEAVFISTPEDHDDMTAEAIAAALWDQFVHMGY